MNTLLEQLKKRRKKLGLKQNDMKLLVGVSRQQYQRLESKGNPRLSTLELIAKGLKCEFLLIPQENLMAVQTLLEEDNSNAKKDLKQDKREALVNDPWQDLLEDE